MFGGALGFVTCPLGDSNGVFGDTTPCRMSGVTLHRCIPRGSVSGPSWGGRVGVRMLSSSFLRWDRNLSSDGVRNLYFWGGALGPVTCPLGGSIGVRNMSFDGVCNLSFVAVRDLSSSVLHCPSLSLALSFCLSLALLLSLSLFLGLLTAKFEPADNDPGDSGRADADPR